MTKKTIAIIQGDPGGIANEWIIIVQIAPGQVNRPFVLDSVKLLEYDPNIPGRLPSRFCAFGVLPFILFRGV